MGGSLGMRAADPCRVVHNLMQQLLGFMLLCHFCASFTFELPADSNFTSCTPPFRLSCPLPARASSPPASLETSSATSSASPAPTSASRGRERLLYLLHQASPQPAACAIACAMQAGQAGSIWKPILEAMPTVALITNHGMRQLGVAKPRSQRTCARKTTCLVLLEHLPKAT